MFPGSEKQKGLNPDKEIKIYLVIPYMMQCVNRNKIELLRIYDEIILPEQMSSCHFKQAIFERNKWMVNCCQFLISYVTRPCGGAWKTLQYARERGLQIINLADG